MLRIILPLLLALASFNKQYLTKVNYKPADPALATLKQQVIKDILSISLNGDELMSIAEKMKPGGSWPDIDYADKTRGGWTVSNHLARLNNMAVLYKRPGSKWTNDPNLEAKIISGLDFWFKNDFICPNWWYPEIGVPKILGPTMLLMEDKLSAAEKNAGIKILSRAKIGMTGQNKVWLSGNVIYRSLLTNDIDSIRAAVDAIEGEVVISENEGIQPDYSYHQHGLQQQFGNYGSSYAGDMLKWAVIFQNTPFHFETAEIVILRNYLLQGMRWIIWKNKMDISACGRQLFTHAQVDKARSIEQVYNKMPLIDPSYKTQYETAMDDFDGDKHFWKSDMTVHRRGTFYSSVKMSSRRVGGAESCNDENIQGYHLGDGATYFYQSGEEYTDIFPFWNWKKIPGTTTYQDAAPLPVLPCNGYRIESDFVGGVSDGTNGITSMAYYRDSLTAKKSWFFFNDEIVCLGAGIHAANDKDVATTVNQSFLSGNVIVKQPTGINTLKNGEHDLSEVSWVLHDNWGYYFPNKTNIELTNKQEKGDWKRVLKRMPAKEIQADIFTLWLDHHSNPKLAGYAYFVFPSATANNIDARAAAISLVENSENLQAIEDSEKQMAGIVFINPGEATTKLFNKISTDKPCIIMLTKKSTLLTLTISDPTHLESFITVGLQGRRRFRDSSSRYDAGKDMTYIAISLPQHEEDGKSITLIAD
jgi:chondroitin AC lyase